MRDDGRDLRRQYLEWRDGDGGQIAMPLFRRFAREMLALGRRFGIKLLVERVRWEVGVTVPHDDAGFRLNNNFAPYIARDLIVEMPELGDYIETRRVADENSRGEPYQRSDEDDDLPF